MSLTQYVAWAESRIARVVVAEGVHCGLAQVVQGPMTLTFRLRLLRPSKSELSRLLGLGATLAQSLQSPQVRISDTAQGVLVEVPSPLPRTPTGADLARLSRGPNSAAVGMNSFRHPLFLDFRRNAHLLAVGPTRRGKTEAVKSLLYGMAKRAGPHRLAYLILAKKRQSWTSFEQAAGCYGVLSDDKEIEAALNWLAGDVLQQRTRTGSTSPTFFLVADDLANIAARAKITGTLGELASMGGGVGLHLIVSTQTTGRAGGLTTDLEANLTARLVFGATDAAAAARYAGSGKSGADAVGTSPGDALLIIDGQSQRVATALADDRLIVRLPTGHLPKPWQNHQRTSKTTKEPAKPVLNHQNHPTPTPSRAATRGANEEGGAVEPPPEPVLKPVRIDLLKPITDDERERAASLLASLGSLNKTCRALYGSKNGKTLPRLREALQNPNPAAPASPAAPTAQAIQSGELDLSTAEGRTLFAEMQSAGLVHFPTEESPSP